MKLRYYGKTLDDLADPRGFYDPASGKHIDLPKYEDIAGDYIEEQQIRACLTGQPFKILEGDNIIELPAVDPREYQYYYNVFDTILDMGLPHGQGWLNEQDWVIYLYKSFKREHDLTLKYLEAKAVKNNGKSTADY